MQINLQLAKRCVGIVDQSGVFPLIPVVIVSPYSYIVDQLWLATFGTGAETVHEVRWLFLGEPHVFYIVRAYKSRWIDLLIVSITICPPGADLLVLTVPQE